MIHTICICGAGTMGSGIAQTAAAGGFRTILFDVNIEVLQKGMTAIEKNLKNLTEKGRITQEEQQAILGRMILAENIKDCHADLIIEAIVEKQEAKLDLFRRLAPYNGDQTIFTSNTSSLSITALSEQLPHPERFAGLHFFNPAPIMRLVEVVRSPHTDDSTIQTLLDISKKMGKTPVLCKDAPGFIVNHVARPYYLEALRLVEEGVAGFDTIDDIMEASGFKMGPFRLMDLIGNDINYAVSCSVYEAMNKPSRLRPSPIQEKKVKDGELGRKTGKGYYTYLH
ncbi:MAG: 3-hydroxybutyryl-CoA dehydrogenase [Chitinophagaceae bacterium]|nr:3-hydroxybutyryl-CoA dehydrogenase [Chitinophagaceae bacterium]